MKCSKCGSELLRLNDDAIAVRAVKELGIPFGGTWQCPNRRNHR